MPQRSKSSRLKCRRATVIAREQLRPLRVNSCRSPASGHSSIPSRRTTSHVRDQLTDKSTSSRGQHWKERLIQALLFDGAVPTTSCREEPGAAVWIDDHNDPGRSVARYRRDAVGGPETCSAESETERLPLPASCPSAGTAHAISPRNASSAATRFAPPECPYRWKPSNHPYRRLIASKAAFVAWSSRLVCRAACEPDDPSRPMRAR
jgi:hypothetical protein